MSSLLVRNETEYCLTQEAWQKFHEEMNARSDFGTVLQADFIIATELVYAAEFGATESRAMMRAFGSLIDGLSRVMQEIAVSTAELFGGHLNRFLQEKTCDRSTSTYQRIYNSYRLVTEFLPKSPLARLSDQRWRELHHAIDIRHRIVHPTCFADVQTDHREAMLVINVGNAFLRDFAEFVQWFQHKKQKLLWEHVIERRRLIPKTGRNEKCPCGSQRKYKNCCAAAQYAA